MTAVKILFKQRIFSWFDSYDIYDEWGGTLFTVQGKPAWGHKLEIEDAAGRPLGTVREEILTLLPRFALYDAAGRPLGMIRREWSLFHPIYTLDCNGWEVRGNLLAWDYEVFDPAGRLVMAAHKELFRWSDTYEIEVADGRDALIAVMIVLAIDAAQCGR